MVKHHCLTYVWKRQEALVLIVSSIVEVNSRIFIKICCIFTTIWVLYVVEQFPNDIAKESKHGCSVLPSKHDLILSLAVGGRWITKQHDLQVRLCCFRNIRFLDKDLDKIYHKSFFIFRMFQLDPPHSKMLYLKGATIAFHFTHSWTLAKGL